MGATSGPCGTGAMQVCDIANGACAPIDASQCAPCNTHDQCVGGGFVGSCVTRSVNDWRERVCMQACDVATPCPDGLTCEDGFCTPHLSITCTTWRAAVNRAPCLRDDDCNPVGSGGEPPAGVFQVDSCEGEVIPMADAGTDPEAGMPDAGPATPGRCVQPCGDSSDCFDVAVGQSCMTGTGTTSLTFCLP